MSSFDTDTQIDEKVTKKIKTPSRYNVIFINDDVTPMQFVVELLTTVFRHSVEKAEELTLAVHNEGSAIVGNYTYEVAEQKVHEAITATRHAKYPLKIKMERE